MAAFLEADREARSPKLQSGARSAVSTLSAGGPLVSVVTPVYNGERYLAECIESVLAQTYQNWEYLIVNNCSKDRTLEIARSYARRDPRIRIHDCTEFLPLAENWNRALRLISPESRYCKVVHTDDALVPECLAVMVELAESHPEVGLVAGQRRRMHGARAGEVRPAALPFSEDVISGADASRLYFQRWQNYLGGPSGSMVRADLVRELDPFYNEVTHSGLDIESHLRVLERSSLGFAYQVLSTGRKHEGSQTVTFFKRMKEINLSRLYLLLRYGRRYLAPADYRRELRARLLGYHRLLLKSWLKREWEIWRFHRKQAKLLGVPTGVRALLRVVLTPGLVGASRPSAREKRPLTPQAEASVRR